MAKDIKQGLVIDWKSDTKKILEDFKSFLKDMNELAKSNPIKIRYEDEDLKLLKKSLSDIQNEIRETNKDLSKKTNSEFADNIKEEFDKATKSAILFKETYEKTQKGINQSKTYKVGKNQITGYMKDGTIDKYSKTIYHDTTTEAEKYLNALQKLTKWQKEYNNSQLELLQGKGSEKESEFYKKKIKENQKVVTEYEKSLEKQKQQINDELELIKKKRDKESNSHRITLKEKLEQIKQSELLIQQDKKFIDSKDKLTKLELEFEKKKDIINRNKKDEAKNDKENSKNKEKEIEALNKKIIQATQDAKLLSEKLTEIGGKEVTTKQYKKDNQVITTKQDSANNPISMSVKKDMSYIKGLDEATEKLKLQYAMTVKLNNAELESIKNQNVSKDNVINYYKDKIKSCESYLSTVDEDILKNEKIKSLYKDLQDEANRYDNILKDINQTKGNVQYEKDFNKLVADEDYDKLSVIKEYKNIQSNLFREQRLEESGSKKFLAEKKKFYEEELNKRKDIVDKIKLEETSNKNIKKTIKEITFAENEQKKILEAIKNNKKSNTEETKKENKEVKGNSVEYESILKSLRERKAILSEMLRMERENPNAKNDSIYKQYKSEYEKREQSEKEYLNLLNSEKEKKEAIRKIDESAFKESELKNKSIIKYESEAYRKIVSNNNEILRLEKQKINANVATREQIDKMVNSIKQENVELSKNIDNQNLKNKIIQQEYMNEQKLVLANKTKGTLTKQIGENMKNSAKQLASMYVSIYAIVNQLRQGAQFAFQMDTEVTQISMVTGQSREEVKEMVDQYNQLAKTLGKTTLQITHSAKELYRQGYGLQEVNEKLELYTKLSGVLGEDVDNITELMTASANSLGLSGVELEKYADAVVEVGARAGTSGTEILEAMKKVGSTAKLAGSDVNKLVGYIATISELTREDASSIGDSLKTIYAKFQQVNKATAEGKDEFGKVSKAIKNVGIEFTDLEGQIRPVDDILLDLSKKWSTLTENQRKSVSTSLGVYQFNRFTALMENFDRAIELSNVASDSIGATERQYSKYMESIEAKLNQLKATWEAFMMNLMSDGTMAMVIDALKGLVGILDEIVNKNRVLSVGLIGIGVALKGIFGTIKLLGTLGIAIPSTFIAPILGTVAGLTALAGALIGVANHSRKAREEQEKLNVSIKKMDKSKIDDDGDKIIEYKKLLLKSNRTDTETKEMKRLSIELSESLGDVIGKREISEQLTLSEANAMLKYNEALSKKIELLGEENSKTSEGQSDREKRIEDLMYEKDLILQQNEALNKPINTQKGNEEIENSIGGTNNFVKDWDIAVDNSGKLIENKIKLKEIDEDLLAIENEKRPEIEKQIKLFKEQLQAKNIINQTDIGYKEILDENKDKLKEFYIFDGNMKNDLDKAWKEYYDSQVERIKKTYDVRHVDEFLMNMERKLQDYADSTKTAIEKTDILATAYEELTQNGYLQAETYDLLKEKHKGIDSAMEINEKNIKNLMDTQNKANKKMIEDQIKKTEVVITSTKLEIEAMTKLIDSYSNVAHARLISDNEFDGQQEAFVNSNINAYKRLISQLSINQSALNQYKNDLKTIQGIYNNSINKVEEKRQKEYEKEMKENEKLENDYFSNLQYQIEKSLLSSEKLKENISTLSDDIERFSTIGGDNEFFNTLEKQNELIEEQRKLISEYNNEKKIMGDIQTKIKDSFKDEFKVDISSFTSQMDFDKALDKFQYKTWDNDKKSRWDDYANSFLVTLDKINTINKDIISTEDEITKTVKDSYKNALDNIYPEKYLDTKKQQIELLEMENEKYEKLGLTTSKGYIENLKAQIKLKEDQIKKTSEHIMELKKEQSTLDLSTDEGVVKNEALKESIGNVTEEYKSYISELGSFYDKLGSVVKSFEDDLMDSIRKSIESERETTINKIKNGYQTIIDSYTNDVKALQDQLDALNDKTEERENTIDKLKEERDKWLKDDSIFAKSKVQELNEQMANEEKELQKELLQQQIKDKQDAINAIKDAMDKEVKEQEDKFGTMLEDQNIYKEKSKLIEENRQKEILDLLTKFNPKYIELSNTLGQSYHDTMTGWINSALESIKATSKLIEEEMKKLGFDKGKNPVSIISGGNANIVSASSGMYTGDWSGQGGKLAVLHKKERVLSADQTRAFDNLIYNLLPKLYSNLFAYKPNLSNGNEFNAPLVHNEIYQNNSSQFDMNNGLDNIGNIMKKELGKVGRII